MTTLNGIKYVGALPPPVYSIDPEMQKWEEIKIYRTKLLETGGFQYGPHWYHSDTTMKTEFMNLKMKVLEAIILGGADLDANIVIDGGPTLVKTMDNGYMPVTGNDILGIVAAAEIQTKRIYTAAATHQYYLSISSNKTGYNFLGTFWPVTFTGTA